MPRRLRSRVIPRCRPSPRTRRSDASGSRGRRRVCRSGRCRGTRALRRRGRARGRRSARSTRGRQRRDRARLGRPRWTALELYERQGRLRTGSHDEEVVPHLLADWHAYHDPDGSVMIAHYRADVAELNGRARALMRADGQLSSDEVSAAGRAFASGRSRAREVQRPPLRRSQRRSRGRRERRYLDGRAPRPLREQAR
jgi:hypothetical protein